MSETKPPMSTPPMILRPRVTLRMREGEPTEPVSAVASQSVKSPCPHHWNCIKFPLMP
jgi:hypothetical protein